MFERYPPLRDMEAVALFHELGYRFNRRGRGLV